MSIATILNSTALAGMNRDVKPPLGVMLQLEPGSSKLELTGELTVAVEIETIYRLVPGKRLVGLCRFQNTNYVIKLFFQPKQWSRHLTREVEGNKRLAKANIPAPDIMAFGVIADNSGGYLLMQYLENASEIGLQVAAGDYHNFNLTERVIQLIASCHEAGIWQEDIHLDNFLLHENNVYLLDAAAIRCEKVGKSLEESIRFNNLALFFAQFPVLHDRNLVALTAEYCRLSNISPQVDSARKMDELVNRARASRLDAYDKKIFRSSTAHCRVFRNNYLLICNRDFMSDEVRQFAQDPDAYINRGSIVKPGNTTTVALVNINQQTYVIKRYNLKNYWLRIKRLLTRSRAWKSWQSALELTMLGVNTPRPVLMYERRILWWLRKEAYILCEFQQGELVSDVLNKPKADPALVTRVFEQYRDLFSVMSSSKISHGDMKATNFIFNNGHLYALDLDAVTRHRRENSFSSAFAKDLKRFVANWEGNAESPEISARAAELAKVYLPAKTTKSN